MVMHRCKPQTEEEGGVRKEREGEEENGIEGVKGTGGQEKGEIKVGEEKEKEKALKGKEGNRPKPAEVKIGRHSLVVNAQLGIIYSVRKFFHHFMSVLSFDGGPKYLLGVQIAGVLKRKTFNLYHCMKKKHIELRRASQDQIEFLMSVGAVPIGTHSVTFVPIADGLCFVADALYRYVRFPNEDPSSFILKKQRSYTAVKHQVKRRKPLPWDLHRSIKKTASTSSQTDGYDPQNYFIQSSQPTLNSVPFLGAHHAISPSYCLERQQKSTDQAKFSRHIPYILTSLALIK